MIGIFSTMMGGSILGDEAIPWDELITRHHTLLKKCMVFIFRNYVLV